jgi:trimeric autotransporter adhesin
VPKGEESVSHLHFFAVFLLRAALAGCSVVALTACGGGGGAGGGGAAPNAPPPAASSPSTAPTLTVGGVVGGLPAGDFVTLALGDQTVSPSADGSFNFPVGLASGATYDVQIARSPAGSTCRVFNGVGVLSAAPVSAIRVACVASLPGTNGTVSTAAVSADGQTLFLAGRFTRIGPNSGSFVPVSSATAVLRGGSSSITGIVRASVPDGSGGWYVAAFLDRKVTSIWRLNASGKVSTVFRADVTGTVWALALADGRLHVGGEFSEVGAQRRQNYAVLDANTGAVLAGSVSVSGDVYSIAIGSGQVYLGGIFTSVGSETRRAVAALDRTTGALLAWNPQLSGTGVAASVRSIRLGFGSVYVAGFFDRVSGQDRRGLAALDPVTGQATGWDPALRADDGYREYACALEIANGVVYAGGGFNRIGGELRSGVAAIDPVSGKATAWNARLGAGAATGYVCVMAASADLVYIGGDFTSVGGSERAGLAAVDATTGAASAFAETRPLLGSAVYTLGLSGDTLWVGGEFAVYGGVARPGTAAVNLRSGQVLDWAPDLRSSLDAVPGSGTVSQLLVTPAGVVIAGRFDLMNGVLRRGIGAVTSTGSGSVLSWPALPTAESVLNVYVDALALEGGVLYFGGLFDSVAGQSRRSLAAVNASTFDLLPWTTSTAGRGIARLQVVNGILLAEGQFSLEAGTQGLRSLLAFDRVSGKRLALDPGITNGPLIWDATSSVLYLGGFTVSLRGAPYLEASSAVAQPELLVPWPRENTPFLALGVFAVDSQLFVTEQQTSVALDSPEYLLRQRDPSTIAVLGGSVSPAITFDKMPTHMLALTGAYVVVGNFTRANGQPTGGLLVVPR